MEVKMEHDLFESILLLALQQKIGMGETLQVTLTPVPLCLAPIDGSMLKTPKTLLIKKQETGVISEAPSNIDNLVIDGIFFQRLFQELPETFCLLAKSILKADSKVWENFADLKLFKNDEKYFLFHLKSSFRSEDI